VNTTSNKRRLASGISVIAIAAALSVATPALAQTTSSVIGHVAGAAPGTVVTVTDLNTGHTDTGRVDANGTYNIVGLTPSTYRVQSGNLSQTVVVPLGQAVTVDLAPAPAAAGAGAIVVTGARTKDVKTPAVTTNVSRFQIENLPNGDRNFLNFAALAPGVVVAPPTLNGKARQVQAGAVSSDNTNTFIDGISIKNLVNHGGTIGQNYSSGNPFPASAVDQFNVETQNFKAEFEQAGSAVISTVTKTGGNAYHGEIFGEWQPKAFISRNYDDRPGHRNNPNGDIPKPDFSTKFYGGNFGGPIIKDKLTFFVDFEGTNKTFASSDINVYPTIDPSYSPAAQAFAQSARSQFNGSFPATFKEKLYFGKLTWFATPDDTVNVSAFIRDEANLQINGGVTTTSGSTLNRNNQHRYEAWWNHRGSNWLNEFIVARDVAQNGAIPNTPGSQYVVTFNGPTGIPSPFASNQLILGGLSFVQDDNQYQTLIKDNVTLYGGAHTIKFGAKVNFTKLQRLEDNLSQGAFYYDARTFTGVDSSTPFAARINSAAVQPVSAKNKEIGLFAQDDWRPDDHWQVSAGLRWDYESNAKNEDFVTPPDVAAALRAYPGWPAAGLNPEDYISNGHNRKPFWGAFQPRLGVSYDVRGDRELVFFGGAGRYYDRSLFIDSALETIKDYYESVATLQTCASNPGLVNCIPGPLPTDPDALRALAATQPHEVILLNNKTKVPYSDEVNFGVRKRFGNINTSATLSYIKSHNIFQILVGNRLPNGNYLPSGDDTVFNYNGDPYSGGIFLPGAAIFAAPLSPQHGSLFIGNSDGKATYTALYLQADKPYTDDTGWGFTTTLTVSRTRTNDSRARGQIGDPFYFDSPHIGDLGWGTPIGAERWRFVGSGTVRIPFVDARLSTIVTLSSGPIYGGVLCDVPSTAPGGGGCYPNTFGLHWPHGIGYKNVDFNLSKSVRMPWSPDQKVTLYFQALNAFDFVNRNYSEWTGGFTTVGGPGPSHHFDRGSVASQGRNFKVGARFTF
jgi:outer membrane receptor for ferrienterochelin and colicin